MVMGFPSKGAEQNMIQLPSPQIQRISTPSIILVYSSGDWARRRFNRRHSWRDERVKVPHPDLSHGDATGRWWKWPVRERRMGATHVPNPAPASW